MRRALVLNATYEPLSVVPTRRAVCLVLAEKAEVLHDDDGLPVVGGSLRVPRVLHLRRYERVRRPVIRLTRKNVMLRDAHQCQYCGGHADSIDHVLPRSRGGGDSWENLVACCVRCNNVKGNRTPEEMGWTMSVRPRAPRGPAWVVRGADVREPSWEEYLGSAA